MIDARQRGEAEAALDKLQQRVMFVELPRQVAASRPGGDHKGGYPHTRTIRIKLRRRHMVEIATTLVISEEEDRTSPQTGVHQAIDHTRHLLLTHDNVQRRVLARKRGCN